jgi:hypothetical protein
MHDLLLGELVGYLLWLYLLRLLLVLGIWIWHHPLGIA